MYTQDPNDPLKIIAVPACRVDFRTEIERKAEERANKLVARMLRSDGNGHIHFSPHDFRHFWLGGKPLGSNVLIRQ